VPAQHSQRTPVAEAPQAYLCMRHALQTSRGGRQGAGSRHRADQDVCEHWCGRVAARGLGLKGQGHAVWSLDAVASMRPSLEQAMDQILEACPVKDAFTLPVDTSHTCTTPASPPDARASPSGVQVTARTPARILTSARIRMRKNQSPCAQPKLQQ